MPEEVIKQYNDMEGVHPPGAGAERPRNPAVHTFSGTVNGGWVTLDVGERLQRVESVAVQFAGIGADDTLLFTSEAPVFVVLGRAVPLASADGEPGVWDYFAPRDGGTRELHHAKGIYKLSLFCRQRYAYTVWITGDDTPLPD